jgi:hypothetical protein
MYTIIVLGLLAYTYAVLKKRKWIYEKKLLAFIFYRNI